MKERGVSSIAIAVVVIVGAAAVAGGYFLLSGGGGDGSSDSGRTGTVAYSGTWESPEEGFSAQHGSVEFTIDYDEESITGDLSVSEDYFDPSRLDISLSGTVDGDSVEFSGTIDIAHSMEFEGTIQNGTITGTWNKTNGPSGDWSAESVENQ